LIEYAIKKIILTLEEIDEYLQEAKTLAMLSHKNIVSYRRARLEQMSIPFILREIPSTDMSATSKAFLLNEFTKFIINQAKNNLSIIDGDTNDASSKLSPATSTSST